MRCDFSIYFGGGVLLPAMLEISKLAKGPSKALPFKGLWVRQFVSGWCSILIIPELKLLVDERRTSVRESRA